MVSLALDSNERAETCDRVGKRQFNHGKQLVAGLRLGVGQAVLDVGCGTGLLSAHMARLVGPSGKVEALDPLPLRNASSFGNFLSALTPEQRASAYPLLDQQLERRSDAQGIGLERHLSFALGKRPI